MSYLRNRLSLIVLLVGFAVFLTALARPSAAQMIDPGPDNGPDNGPNDGGPGPGGGTDPSGGGGATVGEQRVTTRWTDVYVAPGGTRLAGVVLRPGTPVEVVNVAPYWINVTSALGDGWIPLNATRPGAPPDNPPPPTTPVRNHRITAWTHVYTAPDGARTGVTLRPGTPVAVLGRSPLNNWVNVAWNGGQGWVPANKVEEALIDLPVLADLPRGWSRINPAGNTGCSQGTPYSFWVRPGDPEKVLLYFQGGGACWFGEICDLALNPTYDPLIDQTDNPANAHGIFAFANTENPFADYSVVYAPYCTADVHIGDTVGRYPVAGRARPTTVNHNGYNNARAVLDWLFANYRAPETVFVTGSSAGAIPSPFYATIVGNHYPQTRLVQLGDAAGGYRSPQSAAQILTAWNTPAVLARVPGFAALDPASTTFESLYTVAAAQHPDAMFAQYNTAHDDVQVFFLSLLGMTDVDLLDLISANYADIDGEADNFVTYTAGGELHTILGRPEFYTYAVDGLRFRDWIADLAAGRPVGDVLCSNCTTAETVGD